MKNNKIMVLCHSDDNFKKINELVYPNHIDYCNKHGFIYKRVDTKEIKQDTLLNKEIYWLKLLAVQKELEINHDIDWIFMMDMDCVFLKQNIPLSFFIESANEEDHMLVCYMGRSIKNFFRVNVGAIFLKNTPFIRNFINYWINTGQTTGYTIFEQICLQDMLGSNNMNILDYVSFFPEHTFNHGTKNSFLFHACHTSSAFSDKKIEDVIEEKIQDINNILNYT